MTFLVAAALAVAALVILPIAAHLLRRGRAEEQEFPPAHLVPVAPPVARQRSRLEDRALFALRALMVALLAALGATPFIRCSKLSLSRSAGASVAIAIVVDDSLSMRAVTVDGPTRWDLAVSGARDLLDSARQGDAIAIVMAGKPARLALAATTDLAAARTAIDALEPSDRPTDLAAATQLARSVLRELPHVDKRVALLSDLAGDPIPDGDPPVWTPLEGARTKVDNCGIVSALSRGRRVTITAACTSTAAARGRTVSLEVTRDPGVRAQSDAGRRPTSLDKRGPIATVELLHRSGRQTVSLSLEAPLSDLDAHLSDSDAIAQDDVAPVAPHAAALTIAVVADPATASVETGGPTLVEQALAALETDAVVRPLTVTPNEAAALRPHAAIVLDDPPGITADARVALEEWLRQGGVALAMLGPSVARMPLGSTLDPFATGAVRWEATKAKGMDPASFAWLGKEAASLGEIGARRRATLAGAEPPGSRVAGRWTDTEPFLIERPVGRGLALTAGLPSSVGWSDFALRPAFLSLLDYVASQAGERSGPRSTVAGVPWSFPGAETVEVVGPGGPVPALQGRANEPACPDLPDGAPDESCAATASGWTAVAAVRGRYAIAVDGDPQTRIVTVDPMEIVAAPGTATDPTTSTAQASEKALVDVSPQIALALLVLFAFELSLRALRRLPHRRERRTAS